MVKLANIAPASSVSGCMFCQPESLRLHGVFRHHAITSRLCWTLRADALRATQLRRYTPYMKYIIGITLLSTTCLSSADTIDDVIFDTAIDFIFFEGEEVARTYSEFDYDRAVCTDGEISPYIDKRRPGCVNEKTQIENFKDFREYNIRRNEFLLNNQ